MPCTVFGRSQSAVTNTSAHWSTRIAQGGHAVGIRAGVQYVDVGTLHGYRAAIRLLESAEDAEAATTTR